MNSVLCVPFPEIKVRLCGTNKTYININGVEGVFPITITVI